MLNQKLGTAFIIHETTLVVKSIVKFFYMAVILPAFSSFRAENPAAFGFILMLLRKVEDGTAIESFVQVFNN